MSSESSDEENLELLREAADSQFINDAMFKTKKSKDNSSKSVQIPSLRPPKDDNEQFKSLKVTPQFQAYVARQLSNILEKRLQKSVVANIDYPPYKRKKSGIKLFNESTTFLKVTNKEITKQRKFEIKRRKVDSDDDSDLKSVAVKPEDILNKKDVKFWSNRSKAEVFNYRKQNGQLIYIEKEFK